MFWVACSISKALFRRVVSSLPEKDRRAEQVRRFVLRIPHVTYIIEPRLALISYQDYRILLPTPAGALEELPAGLRAGRAPARPSRIPSLCTSFTRAGIEWRS